MTPAPKKRVLFVCIGNSCRSQMAEGFARTYGQDCMIAASAGVSPAHSVASDTKRAMAEKNIEMEGQFPKALRYLGRAEFDLVVNMSGSFLPVKFGDAKVVDWDVPDPIGMDYDDHRAIRDAIERRVMTLILELRRPPEPKFRGQGSGRLPL
jgi:arsenate reductase